MAGKSDLPYVRGADGDAIAALPVFDATLFDLVDHSGTTDDDEPFELFAEGTNDVSLRILANLSESESLWINFGAAAGVRAPGSFEIGPGVMWMLPTRQSVSIVGAAGVPYTAKEA